MSDKPVRLGRRQPLRGVVCPSCGACLMGAAPVLSGDAPDTTPAKMPDPSDTICTACATPLRLEQGVLRVLRPAEIYEIAQREPLFAQALKAAAILSLSKGNKK